MWEGAECWTFWVVAGEGGSFIDRVGPFCTHGIHSIVNGRGWWRCFKWKCRSVGWIFWSTLLTLFSVTHQLGRDFAQYWWLLLLLLLLFNCTLGEKIQMQVTSLECCCSMELSHWPCVLRLGWKLYSFTNCNLARHCIPTLMKPGFTSLLKDLRKPLHCFDDGFLLRSF